MTDVLRFLCDKKVIAIIRGVAFEYMYDTVGALVEGGICCCEVTFRPGDEALSKETLESIAMIRQKFDGVVAVGAGTVISVQNVRDAAAAGAQYMISPNTDTKVIEETKRLGLVSIPGALTPSEALTAYNAGADIVKLFPAGDLGIGYIKALAGPLSHIPFMAVGGVTAQNAADFIKAGCVGVGAGGKLVDRSKIEAGDFDAIRQVALAMTSSVKLIS